MRKNRFTKHIEQLEEEDLRAELLTLYENVPAVKVYYKMELGGKDERQRIYENAKRDIESKYKTKSRRKPRRPRIQKVMKILSGLEKKAIFSYELIDVYLYDVECALEFARKYDFFSQVLFNNISRSFFRALELISVNLLETDYKSRCDQIIEKSRYIIELHNHLKLEYKKIYEN